MEVVLANGTATNGTTRRAFRLPLNAHRDGIRAAYTDDLLEVAIEKRAESKPVRIQVN
jgi:HSP20 family molecular chaperone IbpA